MVEGLKTGNAVLKDLQQELLSLESVEQLMQDTREAIEYQEEVSAMLSGRLDQSEQESVEKEYERMQSEIRGDSIPSRPSETKRETIVETKKQKEMLLN